MLTSKSIYLQKHKILKKKAANAEAAKRRAYRSVDCCDQIRPAFINNHFTFLFV